MREFLEENRIYANTPEILGLMDKYDHNSDGKISLSEVFLGKLIK